jgi:hypothetical protein
LEELLRLPLPLDEPGRLPEDEEEEALIKLSLSSCLDLLLFDARAFLFFSELLPLPLPLPSDTGFFFLFAFTADAAMFKLALNCFCCLKNRSSIMNPTSTLGTMFYVKNTVVSAGKLTDLPPQ